MKGRSASMTSRSQLKGSVKGEDKMEKNVVVAVFKVESEGYQAFTELRQAAETESYFVSAAALVKKEKDICTYLDGFESGAKTTDDTVIGGLIGMLVGVFAGPIGILLGAGYGTLIGMNVDASDALFEVSMLEQIADKLDDGMVAIVALADEEDDDELDKKFSAYDTIIARFDAGAVTLEVNKAYEMQKEMARLARMELRKEMKEAAHKDLKRNEEILKNNFTK